MGTMELSTYLEDMDAIISEILLCLRQNIDCHITVMCTVINPHTVARSSDKSDEGSSSYAGGDAASS